MELDAVLLARLQFAFTIAFHIIFPSFTIGLSAWIATLLVIWRRTGEARYRELARFWTRIFAVSFAMGVVSGIVLSYQFGTNWSRFSLVVGNVVGPLIGYEVLTAFFLEATFLGILLFGWNRVPPGLHVLSAILVAFGTLFSAFWILSANSWMQYPTGHVIRDGIAYPADWIAAIFNPTFPLRLAHMVSAAYLTTAFVVLATGARYLIAGMKREHGLTMLKMGLGMAVVMAPLQVLIGDSHGLAVAQYQPAKLAAIEAHWNGAEPAPLVLFAIPDEAGESEPLRDLNSLWREPAHHPFAQRAVPRAQGFRAARSAAGVGAVLRIPHHGGHRLHHGRPVPFGAASSGGAAGSSSPGAFSCSRGSHGLSASSPSLPAGRLPRSAASPGSPPGFSAPSTPPRRYPPARLPRRSSCS